MYYLLGTQGCHLCEIAEHLLSECRAIRPDFSIKLIDIAEHTQWQAKFDTLIPVLLHVKTNQFLNWPFNQNDIFTFLEHYHD
jgi:Glutaredoxin-like domain (DUF836)